MTDAVDYSTSVLAGCTTRLRGARNDDLVRLAGWWADGSTQIGTEDAFYPPSMLALIASFQDRTTNGATDVGLCIETADTAELIGFTSLHGVSAKNRHARFAIGLRPDLRGRGYGTDATRTMVRFGFAEMNLHRIDLTVYAYNAPAVQAYLKSGFSVEGTLRDAAYHGGRWHDALVMSVLDTDAYLA